MKLSWWKILTIILLFYTVIAGFLTEVPRLDILHETIRNLYFHVPMWFGMIILLTISMVASILYLRNGKPGHDLLAGETAKMAVLFGCLGLLTGMLWAEYTWGKFWSNDPKQVMSAVGILIYLAYIILRYSFTDEQVKARVSAVFNLLAFPSFMVLIFVLPRLTDSLHPGNGGNPAFNKYDLNFQMRLVFYPAIAAFTLLGIWIVSLKVRIKLIQNKINDGN